MIGTMQHQVMAEFYQKLFQKEPTMGEEKWVGWMVGSSFISIGEHSEMTGMTKEPGRLMFNLETTEVQAEFERIKLLGAKVIKEPYQMGEMWIATLADPDGNYFQLMSPWKA